MRLGLAVDLGAGEHPLPRRLDEAVELIGDAESSGYESVWIGETYSVQGAGMHLPGALTTLAALASRTSLRLGAGVLLFPAWHPLKLAYETALVDHISGGRLILGFGVGRPHLQERFWRDPQTIGVAADETLEALRALWQGHDGFDGSVIKIDGGIGLRSWAKDGIPIVVGGSIRRSVERAASFGIGYHASTSYTVGQIRHQIVRLREAWAERRPASPPPVVHANRLTIVAETEEEATNLGRRWAGSVLRQYNRGGSLHRLNLPDLAAEELFDLVRDDFCIIGTPAQAMRQVAAYADIGVTNLDLRVAPAGMPTTLARRTVRLLHDAGIGSVASGVLSTESDDAVAAFDDEVQ